MLCPVFASESLAQNNALPVQVRWLTLDVGPLVLGTARHPVWLAGQALPHLKRLRLVGDQDWSLTVDDIRREPVPAKVVTVETADCLVRG